MGDTMTRLIMLSGLALVVALVILIAAATAEGATTYIRGDVDCSSTVTMADASRNLLAVADPGADPPCSHNGDTNCDGLRSAEDAFRIVALLAGAPRPQPNGCSPIGGPYATPTVGATPTASPPQAVTHSPTPTGTQAPAPTVTPTQAPTPAASSSSGSWVTGVEPQCQVFPPDNPWNKDISQLPVHPKSAAYLSTMSSGDLHPDFGTVWAGKPIGIPYVIVGGSQPKVPVSFYYASESDPGPYPIPNSVPVEGQPVGQPNTANFGGDRHVIVIDGDNCILYETFDSRPVNGGQSWIAGSGAIWDLSSNALRPDGWTSADAAGLPIFPGLVRYSEVQSGIIDHALRFTVSDTQRAYVHPATHYASSITDPDYPPMGARFRMKASYNCSWATTEVQVICAAMKKYGMIVADNGSDWYVSGAPDSRWDDERIGDLKDIPASAFEVVDTGEPIHYGY
jgi:hypothetical protein